MKQKKKFRKMPGGKAGSVCRVGVRVGQVQLNRQQNIRQGVTCPTWPRGNMDLHFDEAMSGTQT